LLALLFFLLQVFVISLSGAMAPGPVTTAAIALGQRSRYAGLALAIGHAIIEFPLMVLIMLGMDKLLKSTATSIIIGLAGGMFLTVMGIQMLKNLYTSTEPRDKPAKTGPVLTGLILSGSNPYFLMWWATVGLTLATRATELGTPAPPNWEYGPLRCLLWFTGCAIAPGCRPCPGQASKARHCWASAVSASSY